MVGDGWRLLTVVGGWRVGGGLAVVRGWRCLVVTEANRPRLSSTAFAARSSQPSAHVRLSAAAAGGGPRAAHGDQPGHGGRQASPGTRCTALGGTAAAAVRAGCGVVVGRLRHADCHF
jgi:hypothetical protein